MTIVIEGKSFRDVFNDVLQDLAQTKGFSAHAFEALNPVFMEAVKRLDTTPFQSFCNLLCVKPDTAVGLIQRDIEKLVPVIQ